MTAPEFFVGGGGTLKILIRQNGVLFNKFQVSHAHEFLMIQENEAENMFMMLDELFLAFQIYFHHHKYFHDLRFSLFKNCMRN